MNYQEIQNGGSKLRSKEARQRIKKILETYERDKDVCKIEHKGNKEEFNKCMTLAEERKQQSLEESNQLEQEEKEQKIEKKQAKKIAKIEKKQAKKSIKKYKKICQAKYGGKLFGRKKDKKSLKKCLKNAKRGIGELSVLEEKEAAEAAAAAEAEAAAAEAAAASKAEKQSSMSKEEREKQIAFNNARIARAITNKDDVNGFFGLMFKVMEYIGKRSFDGLIALNMTILGMFFTGLQEKIKKGEQLNIQEIFENPELKKAMNEFIKLFAEMFGQLLAESGNQMVKVGPVIVNTAYKVSFRTATSVFTAMWSAAKAVLSTIPFIGTFINILTIIQAGINAGTTMTVNFLRMITLLSGSLVKVTGKSKGSISKTLGAADNILKTISKSTTTKQDKQEQDATTQLEELEKGNTENVDPKLLEQVTGVNLNEPETNEASRNPEQMLNKIGEVLPKLKNKASELLSRKKSNQPSNQVNSEEIQKILRSFQYLTEEEKEEYLKQLLQSYQGNVPMLPAPPRPPAPSQQGGKQRKTRRRQKKNKCRKTKKQQ